MKRALIYLCICAIMSCAFGNAECAETTSADSMAVRRELKGWAKGRWAVVDTREVRGMLVMVSDAVGREIDLEASYRFGLFQGETTRNKTWRLPTVTQPIVGFQSAVFLKLPNGDYAARIAFRDEAGAQSGRHSAFSTGCSPSNRPGHFISTPRKASPTARSV